MIYGTIHHNLAQLWCPAVKRYGIMRLTTRMCNGQSASFSARQNVIMRKAGFIRPSAQNFAVVLLVAWYRKREIRSSSSSSLSSSLASSTVFRMNVSTNSLNARTLCVKLFSVNIMKRRKAHDMLSTRPLPAISAPTQPMKLTEEAHYTKA